MALEPPYTVTGRLKRHVCQTCSLPAVSLSTHYGSLLLNCFLGTKVAKAVALVVKGCNCLQVVKKPLVSIIIPDQLN